MEERSLSPAAIIEQFKRNGVTHVVWLPDTETNFMYKQIMEDDDLNLVPICREGESMPIAAGLWIGGKKPVVLIQNTGMFEAGDSIRGMSAGPRHPDGDDGRIPGLDGSWRHDDGLGRGVHGAHPERLGNQLPHGRDR